jgi:glycogen synthase
MWPLTVDHIVAVSPHYAEEILSEPFGSGLDGFLRRRRGSISGILNGLDNARMDPANIPQLSPISKQPSRLRVHQAYELPAECRKLQQRSIQQGISWERAARAYLALYKELVLARQPDYFERNDERRELWT